MSFNLEEQCHMLLREEPFYGAVSRQISKRACEHTKTAAIQYDLEARTFTLLYNPDFMECLPPAHRTGVLMHEFQHLILGHLTTRLPFSPSKQPEMLLPWNIATDLAINSGLVGKLPDCACVPGRGSYAWYPVGATAEYYFTRLVQDQEDKAGPFSEGSPTPETLDDHSSWGEGGCTDSGEEGATSREEVVANKVLDGIIKEAVEKVEEAEKRWGSTEWGSVPYHLRETLRKAAHRVTVSPEAILRYFIRTSRKSDSTSTIRRINRRYPFIHPGRRAKNDPNIAISIDQSGSVNDEMLQKFFSFLTKLGSLATFTVVPFDTQVSDEQVYIWKKGQKRKWERVRHGGTCFDAPTKWVNQRKFDGHIILTDMQAPKPIRSKCQRLWVTDSYHINHLVFQTDEKIIALGG